MPSCEDERRVIPEVFKESPDKLGIIRCYAK